MGTNKIFTSLQVLTLIIPDFEVEMDAIALKPHELINNIMFFFLIFLNILWTA